MSSVRACITGIGTAVPPCAITQEDAFRLASELTGGYGDRARYVEAIYRKSRVALRGSVVLQRNGGGKPSQGFYSPRSHGFGGGPATSKRMDEYTRAAGPLAIEAATGALETARRPAKSVTHVVTASCTGFSAPGVDQALVRGLQMNSNVERTHIGFMGCHGAINALRVARAAVLSQPDACVLVCAVELCSLHLHYGQVTDQIVSNALFADGAGAAIVQSVQESRNDAALEIESTGACLIADTSDEMFWRIGDHGFEMGLSAEVPAILGCQVRSWLNEWLSRTGMALADIEHWAIHPGGPRVLESITTGLGLRRSAADCSREVLERHGNMSSATVLFVLKALAAQMVNGQRAIAMAFGPGLAAEGMVVRARFE